VLYVAVVALTHKAGGRLPWLAGAGCSALVFLALVLAPREGALQQAVMGHCLVLVAIWVAAYLCASGPAPDHTEAPVHGSREDNPLPRSDTDPPSEHTRLVAQVQERTAEVRFLNDLVEQSIQPFRVTDLHGTLVRWNPAFEKLTGYSAAELRQMTYDQLSPERWHAMEAERVADLLRTGRPQHYEKEHHRKDGTLVPVELTAELYRGADGKPQYVFAFVTDIARRRRDEQALREITAELARSNMELEQFAYVASHDLQEPVRKIQSFADLLYSQYHGALDEEGRDLLQRTQSATLRMRTLIQDLLIYARVTSKARPFEPVDLVEVARGVVSDLEGALQESGGRVEIGPLPTLPADPVQMRQLLQNLISNALKFHRKGQRPHVQVHGRRLDPSPATALEAARQGPWWEIAVEDNGIGFEEKYLERIFAPFQRLHGRSEYEGTGMGLAICRKIVERHGGTITARSTPGQGSVFVVALATQEPKRGPHHD
jgi:PAS domain S-box-containing protein